MRETWTSLNQAAVNYVANDTSPQTATFLGLEINRAKTFIYGDLKDYVTERTQTTLSLANEQYYHTPVDCKDVNTIAYTIGNQQYSLISVDSQEAWDRLNAIPFTGTIIPKYFFERKRSFGVWPTPQENNDVITFVYQILDKNMQYQDYSTGSITAANNSQTITGSGTSWDATFVGRWFTIPADGFWYRIIAVNVAAQTLTLETSFEGSAYTGATYLIGDSPDLPEELHPYLAIRAAMMYYIGFRKDASMAVYYSNLFYTGDPKISAQQVLTEQIEPPGGYLSIKNNYATRSTDMVIRRNDISSATLLDTVWGVKATF